MNQKGERRSATTNKTLHSQSEMRLATAMMVDMVDSTAMSERLGPEASFLLLDELLGIARSIVGVHGGIMLEELGDGFFALFGAPISIERASLAASRAGLEVCEAVHAHAGAFTSQFGLAPQLRIGLAAGEVLLTGSQADATLRATGKPVNLAARLQTLAEPNGVVCSKSVALEAGGWVRLEPLGLHSLKGFSDPVETFQMREVFTGGLTQPAGGGRRVGDFVGRAAEIAQLTRWIEETANQRPVSLIVGAAGIGKSRLTAEFATRLGQRRLIVGSCHPTTTARPLAPLIEILRGFAKWHPGLETNRLIDALDPILPPEQADRALLITLIAGQASPETEADASDAIALRRAMEAALTAVGQLQDCLLVIEDLHWIDPLSAEILLAVVRAAPGRFQMLGTTRPVDWLDQLPQDRIERVRPGPLQAAEIGAIARTVMGAAADEALVEKLAQNSEGNPFFAIEILHNVAAQGEGVEAGRIGTIQNIALARFDRLDDATKALLRMASVQGRSFRLDVLGLATEAGSVDIAGLLTAAEGIVEPDPVDPEGSGRFHHILHRDSIYATIPSTARGTRHLVVARALETCAGDGVWLVADQLADHYELADDPLRAVKYLRIAAGNAYGLFALEGCNSLMERAFRLIDAHVDEFSPEALEDAVSIRIRCLAAINQFRSVIAVSQIWLPRLRTPEGSPALALLLALTSKVHCHMTNYEASHRLATEALEIATRVGNELAIAYAKVALMRALTDSGIGSLEEVERLYDETRAFAESLNDSVLYSNRMYHMMAAYRSEGMFRRAMQLNDEMQEFAARHTQRHVQLFADWNRSLNAMDVSDYETALALAEAGLEDSVRDSGAWIVFKMLKLASQLNLGIDVPLESIERIHDNSDRRGDFTTRNSAAMMLGYALCAKGKLWRGWRQFRKSDARIFAAGHVEMNRFLLLHRAEFLLVVAGLIDVDRPRPKLGFLDILVAIHLRMTARRSARALLHQLLLPFDRQEGLFVARARAALAVIAAAEGDAEAAKEGFALAERLFRAEGLTAELDRLARLRAKARL